MKILAACAACGVAALIASGCSGSSSSGHAVIRAVNSIVQEGAMTMVVNSGAVNGTQPYGVASDYLFLPKDGTSTASFILSNLDAGPFPIATKGLKTFDVDGDNAYTLVAYGSTSSAVESTSPLAPNILVLTDNSNSIPAHSALLRITNVAPDGGTIVYTLNNGEATPLTYGASSAGSSTGYVTVPAGTTTLSITSAATGAELFDPSPQSFNLSAGQAYTVLISEPEIAVTTTTGTTSTTTGSTTYSTIFLNDR